MTTNDNQPQSAPDTSGKVVKPKHVRHRQWGSASLWLLFAIAGLVAGRLGQLYPHFDVFAQFGMQFVAIVFAFTIAMAFTRFKTVVGLALTVAFLAAYGAWPHFVSAKLQQGPYTLQTGEKLLRIANFNVFKNNEDYNAIAAEVLRLDADVVSLLEMSKGRMQGVLPLLSKAYPYVNNCDNARFCDMAILSKYPITQADGRGEWIGAPYVRATLGGEMAGVTIVGVHTTRFPHSRAQLKQARELVKLLETYAGDLIVMGDFNATPFSRVTRIIEEGADLMRLTELPTWPTHVQVPQLAIDHVFASKSFRVVADQQIGNAAGSDHYPILITVALKPQR